MSETIEIRMTLQLEVIDSATLVNRWILFDQWLPDGIKDAVHYESSDRSVMIDLWFERHGDLDGEFIEFELGKHEVPEDTMTRQSPLESGPLYGRIRVEQVDDAVAEAIRKQKKGDPNYVAFARRLLKDHIELVLSSLVSAIRDRFGQYWVPKFLGWDSRRMTIGSYCRRLGMTASFDGGATRHEFVPDGECVYIAATLGPHRRDSLISQRDWEYLQQNLLEAGESPLALQVLRYSHELLETGNVRHALTEVATALEIAFSRFLKERACEPIVKKALAPLLSQSVGLRTKLTAVCLALSVDAQDLEYTIQAIDARNKLVHEGTSPPAACKQWLPSAFRVCELLLPGPPLKFPTASAAKSIVHAKQATAAECESE